MANKLTPGSNIRWKSSRMMLPEHVAALKKHMLDKQKTDRPELCKEDITEIEDHLKTAIKNYKMIDMEYFKDGFIKHRICQPYRLDAINRQLVYRDAYGLKARIDFRNIMAVKMSTVENQ
ncbi:MAG: YolD-like family protein [Sporolactobacillus sp.]|jgi:hypothetical protein|nr:YolD-like family protein [Sporolactobacillus sp.]